MNAATILFVDDEEGVLRAMRRLFRRENVRVLTAASGAAGLELLEQHDVNVVVSDQRMPAMSGTDFMKKVRERYPNIVRCILSGYAEMHAIMAAINDGNVYRFLAKPWDDAELVETLRECCALAQSNSSKEQAVRALADRAKTLEQESEEYAHLLELQDAVLNASREILQNLPIPIVAIDRVGRMIYSNRRFSERFAGEDGTLLGQRAGELWRDIAEHADSAAPRRVTLNDIEHLAHVSRVAIGGEAHALIALHPKTP